MENWQSVAPGHNTLDLPVAKYYHQCMSQPVKLPDDLIMDARKSAQITHRSISSQIGFWAALGRAIEPVVRGDRSFALIQSGKAVPLSESIARIDTPEGRKLVREYLDEQPYPHYVPVPQEPGLLYRIEEDGKKTKGRFINRRFTSVE